MMKKLFILLSFLICSFYCFSQGPFPIKQGLGSPSTLLKINGASKDSLATIVATWPDTTTANLNSYIKFYPAAMIYTLLDGKSWIRNATATAWGEIGSGSGSGDDLETVLNNGSTLTTNHTVVSTGTTLNWSSFNAYRIGGNEIDLVAIDSMRLIGIGRAADTTGGFGIPIRNKVTGALQYINFNTITSAVPVPDLQTVTGIGNNTTNGATFSNGGKILGLSGGFMEWNDGATAISVFATGLGGNNYSQFLPAGTGVYTLSVNGQLADSNGNVSISAGASSLQDVTNIGNATDTTIVNAGNVSYSEYGTVWTDNFARASIGANYGTNGAGITYTFPSSAYMNLTCTANSNNDYFYRLDSTNENKGSITKTIVVNSKSASTFGIYFGWGGINAVSTNHPVFGGVTLTTGSNNLFFLAETTPFTYNDPQTLTIAAGDTIVLTLSRVDWTYTMSYFNYTGDVSRSFTYTAVPQGSVLPFTPNGFSRPEFHVLGADIRVYNASRISNESKNARNVFGYNSLQLGGNLTDASQKMGYIACGGNHANVIYAAGGGSVGAYLNATYDEDLARYAAGGAENFWCEVSGNDSAFSQWEIVGKPALIAARNRWVAAGKRWIWVQPFPRNALNLRAVADTVTAIATRLGDPLVPIFDRFNVANQLPADFNAGDGVHLTAYANRYAGYYIDSLFPQYTRQNRSTGVSQSYTVNAQNINFTGTREYNYTAAAQTYTLPADFNYIRINPSSTLATAVLQLPTIVDSGHIYFINFGGQLTSGVVVTALTLNAGTGQSITRMPFVEPVGGVTAIPFGVGDMIICRYLNNGRWEATPIRTGYYTDLFIAGRRLGAGLNQSTQDNTVFGYAAGNTITSGTDLTLIGNQAGQLINSGVRNTAVGNEALMNTSTGSNNTALGEESIRQSNGSNRTAVGYASCFNCTGSDVVAMGVNAMFANTSGANNTGIGSGAIQNNATGSGNTAVGMNALFGVAANSNSFNTAIGIRALTSTTTGGFNIALGDSAGHNNTTGIRNILIGTAVTASSATTTNELNIGGIIFGKGLTAAGTSTAGSIGVGVAPGSISAKLHLPAQTATAGTAPLKIGSSATLLTATETDAIENDGLNLRFTNSTTERGYIVDSRVFNGNNLTLSLAMGYSDYVYGGGVAATWSLPAVTGTISQVISVANTGAGTLTIDVTGGASTIFTTSAVASVNLATGDYLTFVSTGSVWKVK